MSDFKADFQKHSKAAGSAAAAGNFKQAMHHVGHMARVSKSAMKGPGTGTPGDAAFNATPVGDEPPDPSIMRGFGPGRQFGKGSATGTPKPKVVDGQKPSARGILSRMKGFGAAKK